jgi:2-methylisocitrate lyase-like PEP mutase family enzyme
MFDGTQLRDAEEAAARVAGARARADAEGVPIVINARTDVYLRGADDPEAAILRGQAYARAGADCVFVPGVTDRDTIRALVEGIDAPVSVLARPGAPSVSELQELGVARVSFGPGPMGAALAALARTASDLLAGGVPADELSYRPPAA